MRGYWRIPKEWMHGWGLTATECIVLADVLSWNCTHKEHARRCCIPERSYKRAWKAICENESAKMALLAVPNWHQEGAKLALTECQTGTLKGAKMALPPTPPYIEEHIEEKKKNESEARAHTREGNVRERVEAAPDPSVVAPLDQVYREHRAELSGDTELAQTAIRLFGIDRDRLLQAADIFRDHLAADGIAYKSRGDYRRHFNAWLKLNAKRIFNDNGNRINKHLSITSDLLREFTT